ncbi:MAG TPA: T9SS type A sorting domain-containing protein, partial [Bacteroidetes bacterium]|nr:T9SS type A sorting domain-containing protein [Bacteroidota bacterium]
FSLTAFSQNKRDYKWVMGLNRVELRGGDIIDFDNHRSIDTGFLAFAMGRNNVSISDKYGNLLMYSNGCAIADKTHHIMEGGDSINYGLYWEKHCTAKYNTGYSLMQNSLILPDPGNSDSNSNGYYLLHKRTELLKEPYLHFWCPGVSYSYVDMNANSGKGKVIKKNKLIFNTTTLAQGYMTACKHANGKDWWIIQIESDTNIYFKILLTKDTVMVVDSQSLAGTFPHGNSLGQAVFSPDGSKWIAFNYIDKALIYDFDRATGELSNLQRVNPQTINPQDSGVFVGVAVSPNSRFVYLSSGVDLYQADLWANDIQSSLVHIAHRDYFPDPDFYSDFTVAQLAPDCKIYIVAGITNNYLHVINKPNLKGKACDFRQHSFYLPNLNDNGSLPNFPHFRIDEDQICDSTITLIPDEYIFKEINKLNVYPNPVSDEATISVYSDGYEQGKISIYTITGELVRTMYIDSEATKSLDVKSIKPGVYIVKYIPEKGKEEVRKLIVGR